MNSSPLITVASNAFPPAPGAGASPGGATPPAAPQEFRRALGQAREDAEPRRSPGAQGDGDGNAATAPDEADAAARRESAANRAQRSRANGATGTAGTAGPRPARDADAAAARTRAGAAATGSATGSDRGTAEGAARDTIDAEVESAESAEGPGGRRGAARARAGAPGAPGADGTTSPAADAPGFATRPELAEATGTAEARADRHGNSPRTTPTDLLRGGLRGTAGRAATEREGTAAASGQAGVRPGFAAGGDPGGGSSGTPAPGARSDAASPALDGAAGRAVAASGLAAATALTAHPATGATTGTSTGAADPGAVPRELHLATGPGRADFAPALGAQISVLVRDGVQAARLQLHPAELGPVTVQLSLEGTSAQLVLAAEQAPTRQALEQALPVLAGALRDAGFTLSGGGVFEQPRQDRPAGENPDGSGRDDRGQAAPTAAAQAAAALPLRRRGMVDLVA